MSERVWAVLCHVTAPRHLWHGWSWQRRFSWWWLAWWGWAFMWSKPWRPGSLVDSPTDAQRDGVERAA